MTTIYLIVGGKIRTAEARIVGKIAEVQTKYGIREFYAYYLSKDEALRRLDTNVEFSGGAPLFGAASAGTQGYASGGKK